jgi:predicted alpha-1,2-mannosidase
MVGDPGALVMADAYLKGIQSFDVEKAYAIACASAKSEKSLFGKPFHSIHPDCEQYKTEAYVPMKLSDTLEFLLADHVMALLARKLGKTEDQAYFEARAASYVKNYDPAFGFMVPRDENGDFVTVKDRYDTCGCVESNIFQQSWFVPYDVEGLARLFGEERMIVLLEELFERADFGALWNEDYNHSNEPCHNLTHYFNVIGLPERTQYWTRRVQKEAYRLGAFGFCGNEDVGQLSAWYVLSALGFAQVCMGTDRFYINTPLFRSAVIRLDNRYHGCGNSDRFRVVCDRDPLTHPYIRRMLLNGAELDRCYVTYEEITNGGTLELKLSENGAV